MLDDIIHRTSQVRMKFLMIWCQIGTKTSAAIKINLAEWNISELSQKNNAIFPVYERYSQLSEWQLKLWWLYLICRMSLALMGILFGSSSCLYNKTEWKRINSETCICMQCDKLSPCKTLITIHIHVNSSPLVPHICLGNWVSIDSGKGLSPVQHQAITWTNAELLSLLSIGPVGTNFSEILIKIQNFRS